MLTQEKNDGHVYKMYYIPPMEEWDDTLQAKTIESELTN